VPSTIQADPHLGSDGLLDPGLSSQADGHSVVLLPFHREPEKRAAAALQADPFGDLEEDGGVAWKTQSEPVREFVLGDDGTTNEAEQGLLSLALDLVECVWPACDGWRRGTRSEPGMPAERVCSTVNSIVDWEIGRSGLCDCEPDAQPVGVSRDQYTRVPDVANACYSRGRVVDKGFLGNIATARAPTSAMTIRTPNPEA
jgi:hypothetical protein